MHEMNCAEFRERHLDILDTALDRLPPLAVASLRAHARRCADCGRLLEEAAEFRSLVREAVREGPTLDWNFTRRVIDALPERTARPRRLARRLYDRAMLPIAAAAVIAICVALAWAPEPAPALLDYASDYCLVVDARRGPILGAAFDALRVGDVVETPPSDVAGLTAPAGRVGLGPRTRVEVGRAGRLALLEGEAAVRTSSSEEGLFIDAAGRTLRIDPGSLVRITVRSAQKPLWIADVAEGSLFADGRTFGPGTKARRLLDLGTIGTPLTEGEIAAVRALADRRPARESAAERPSRDERPPAIVSLRLRGDSPDVARDAVLARLGDDDAVDRLAEIAARSTQEAERALAAIAVLPPPSLREAARRLTGNPPDSPDALTDFTKILAAADPAEARKTVREWFARTNPDRLGEPTDVGSLDVDSLAQEFDSESRALLSALALADGESDAEWWLAAMRESEERLERVLLATLAMTGEPKNRPIWEEIIADPDPRRRALGARGLRFIADPEASPILLAAIERESDADARVALVAALADLPCDRRFDDRIAAVLEAEFFGARDERIPRFAARGLGLRHESLSLETIEGVLSHPDMYVRLNAALPVFTGGLPAPDALVAHCLADAHSDNDGLALFAASRSGAPGARDELRFAAADGERPRIERELALSAWIASGASPREAASFCEALLDEHASNPASAPAPGAIWAALSELPIGSASGSDRLLGAARDALVDAEVAVVAARALVSLGERELPDALAAARDSAEGEDRLKFSVALVTLGDDSGVEDVVYRLRRRHVAAIRALAPLRGIPLPSRIIDAVADVSTSPKSELAYRALRWLSEIDGARAAAIARKQIAHGTTPAERLDGALALARIGADEAASAVVAALMERDGAERIIDWAALGLGLSATEIVARLDEWTPSRGPCGLVDGIIDWRDTDANVASPVAADERSALERRVRRVESLLRSLEATRARFLDALCGEFAGDATRRRDWVAAALTALDDTDVALLIDLALEHGDDGLRRTIAEAAARPDRRSTPFIAAARLKLRDWLSSTSAAK